ncbi:MAG: hypothetical protein AAFV26_01170 [Pseudomonadota bacterium]
MTHPKPSRRTRLAAATLAAIAGSLLTAPLSAGSAEAAIRCKDGFQWSGGRWIGTPYCSDRQLVKVAREFGVRTTFNAVRWDLGEKRRVCRVVGHDIRVSQACSSFRNERRKRFFLFGG